MPSIKTCPKTLQIVRSSGKSDTLSFFTVLPLYQRQDTDSKNVQRTNEHTPGQINTGQMLMEKYL